MNINVTQQLQDLDGTPMITGKQMCQMCGQPIGNNESLTVRVAAVKSLTAIFRDEQELPGEEKVKRFHLALKITDEDEPDLKADDIVLIKKVVGKMYGPVVVGRMWTILD